MNKTYFSKGKAKIVFAVETGAGIKNVSFSNFGGSYSTSDKEEQKAIEDTFYFKKGLIYAFEQTVFFVPENNENELPLAFKYFPEVTLVNDAVAILRNEPYGIPVSKLKSRKDISAVARELNICFPNLPKE